MLSNLHTEPVIPDLLIVDDLYDLPTKQSDPLTSHSASLSSVIETADYLRHLPLASRPLVFCLVTLEKADAALEYFTEWFDSFLLIRGQTRPFNVIKMAQ